MLILVMELTISYYGAHFISRYGCKEYFNHNKELLFYERQKENIREIDLPNRRIIVRLPEWDEEEIR